MQNPDEKNKALKYMKYVVLAFVVKSILIGCSLLFGTYFSPEEKYADDADYLRTLFIFLDVVSIIEVMHVFDILLRKCLFQLLLYVPSFIYSSMLIMSLLYNSYKIISIDNNYRVNIAIFFLYAYCAIIAMTMIGYLLVYRKLKREFTWHNFKNIGANPVINEAHRRREEFIAARKFYSVFFICKSANFYANVVHDKLNYVLELISMAAVLFFTKVTEDREHKRQRVVLLVFLCGFIVVSVVATTIHFIKLTNGLQKAEWTIDNLPYPIISTVLFITVFRDYRMFGSGLKDHLFCKKKLKRLDRNDFFAQ